MVWHYPAFGRVTEGMDEVLRWNTLPVKKVAFPLDPSVAITAPVEPPVLRRVTVETFGWEPPMPVKVEGAERPANWG